jgi:hypothetical protein
MHLNADVLVESEMIQLIFIEKIKADPSETHVGSIRKQWLRLKKEARTLSEESGVFKRVFEITISD